MKPSLIRPKRAPIRYWRAVLPVVLAVSANSLAKAAQNSAAAAVSTEKSGASHGPGVSTRQSSEEKSPAIGSEQALYLVRSTLLTLNDANRSGNYTVFRDLAAPGFQTRNTAADLAQSFSDLRRRNFDLFAVALLRPEFTTEPAIDASGKLRLAGSFPTRPLEISFELTFQSVNGQWRLFSLSVATTEAAAKRSLLHRQELPRAPRPFYSLRIFSGIAGWRW